MKDIYYALLHDLVGEFEETSGEPHAMQVQSLLRHAISETISEGIINCLMVSRSSQHIAIALTSIQVTNSSEANIQLTRIHEQIFAREYRTMLVFCRTNALDRGWYRRMCVAAADVLRSRRDLCTRND